MNYYGIKVNGKIDPNFIEHDRYYLYERYRQTKFDNYIETSEPDVAIVEFEVIVKREVPIEEIEECLGEGYIERVYGS